MFEEHIAISADKKRIVGMFKMYKSASGTWVGISVFVRTSSNWDIFYN